MAGHVGHSCLKGWHTTAQSHNIGLLRIQFFHIRPQVKEYTGSRLLSTRQAFDRRISSQVGDHWRIPAVVCF